MTQTSPFRQPDAGRLHLEALQLLEQGLVQDAVLRLRQAVDQDPSCAPAWNDLGVILEALGNRRDAVHCYRQALRARPDMDEPRRNLMALAVQTAVSAAFPPPVRARPALAVAR